MTLINSFIHLYNEFITIITIIMHVYTDAKQKHPGHKRSAGPIRNSPTYVRPKALISSEAKKSPIKDVSNTYVQ